MKRFTGDTILEHLAQFQDDGTYHELNEWLLREYPDVEIEQLRDIIKGLVNVGSLSILDFHKLYQDHPEMVPVENFMLDDLLLPVEMRKKRDLHNSSLTVSLNRKGYEFISQRIKQEKLKKGSMNKKLVWNAPINVLADIFFQLKKELKNPETNKPILEGDDKMIAEMVCNYFSNIDSESTFITYLNPSKGYNAPKKFKVKISIEELKK